VELRKFILIAIGVESKKANEKKKIFKHRLVLINEFVARQEI